MDGVEVARSHYPLMVTFHALFIISAATEAIVLRRPFPGFLGWTALLGALAAQALRYWCVTTLGWRWTTRVIILPDTPPVSSGPYRFMRHPNYLAVIIEIACVPIIHGCWLTASIFSTVNTALLTLRIRAEEAAMGAGYVHAFGNTPRLVPAMVRIAEPPKSRAPHSATNDL